MMAKRSDRIVFAGCVAGFLSSYVGALGVVAGDGEIYNAWVGWFYAVSFWSSLLVLMTWVFKPVFDRAVISRPVDMSCFQIPFLINVGLLQAILLFGLADESDFWKAYSKYGLLLQFINIVFFLACAQGLSKPFKVHPGLMRFLGNPFGAIGELIGLVIFGWRGR